MKKNLFLIVCLVFSSFLLKAQNAVLIKDLTPGASSSFDDLTQDVIVEHIENKILFVIYDASSIGHLYTSDGTDAGTVQLQQLPSSSEKYVTFIKVSATKIGYSTYNSSSGDNKLYVTDAVGVTLLDKHSPTLFLDNLKAFNGDIFYNSGKALHKIDVDNTSDQIVFTARQIMVDYYFDDAQTLYYAHRSLYDTLFIRNLLLNTEVNLGVVGHSTSLGMAFHKVGSYLLFFGQDNGNVRALYSTTGVQFQTVKLKTFYQDGSTKRRYVTQNNQFFFDAVLAPSDPDFNGYQLWVSDGTSQGTVTLSNASVPLYFLYYGSGYNNDFYFMSSAGDLSNGLHLYRTDGTVANTSLLFNDLISPSLFFSGLVSSNGKLYAAGYDVGDGTYGDEIWDISGSTPVLYETAPGSSAIYQSSFYATDSKFFFIGNESATGYELYLFDPQTPTSVVTSSVNSQASSELFSFYPNPASEQLTLEYNGTDQIEAIRLRDLSGKNVRSFGNEKVLDVDGIASGIYFLDIELKNSKQIIKLVKK